jgi:hypothetical protein
MIVAGRVVLGLGVGLEGGTGELMAPHWITEAPC